MFLNDSCGLKGVGHFTIWFLLGLVVFFTIYCLSKKPFKSKVGVYGPFLPFILAALATIPYSLQVLGLVEKEVNLNPVFNLWLLYPIFEQTQFVCNCFSNFHLNILMLASAYTLLVIHYILFIKSLRIDLSKSHNNL